MGGFIRRTLTGCPVDIYALFANLSSPHIHTPSSRQAFYNSSIQTWKYLSFSDILDLKRIRKTLTPWVKQDFGYSCSFCSKRNLDTSKSDWCCCNGCPTDWYLLSAASGDIKPPQDSRRGLGYLRSLQLFEIPKLYINTNYILEIQPHRNSKP